jgi:type II secretory pathway component PulJ
MRVRNIRSRNGFTLVELMVAAALTILIMTVISVAFQTGLNTLSHLKSMGDLAERLRIAQDRLRDDLEAEHFDRGTSVGPMKVSDLRYDLVGTGSGYALPRIGYFRLEQANGSTYEGLDSTGMMSTRSTGINHAIEYAIRRPLSQPDKLLTARLNEPALNAQSLTDTDLSGQYISGWARVRWELGNPQTINGVTVYTLYRSVRLLANYSPTLVTDPSGLTQSVMSVDATNNIQRIDGASLSTRPLMSPYMAASPKYGDDVVLTNVVSFEVKPTWVADSAAPGNRQPRTLLPITSATPVNTLIPTTVPPPAPPGTFITNTDYPFDDMPVNTFDTSPFAPTDATTLPFRARITGLQIKIRVYEPKNNMTRQSTIVVKL